MNLADNRILGNSKTAANLAGGDVFLPQRHECGDSLRRPFGI
jgi:hypothetical protein